MKQIHQQSTIVENEISSDMHLMSHRLAIHDSQFLSVVQINSVIEIGLLSLRTYLLS